MPGRTASSGWNGLPLPLESVGVAVGSRPSSVEQARPKDFGLEAKATPGSDPKIKSGHGQRQGGREVTCNRPTNPHPAWS